MTIRATRALPLSLLAMLVVSTGAASVRAQEPDDKKSDTYAVVQVDDDYSVIKSSEVKSFKETLDKEFKDAVAAHKEALKAAKAKKEKVTTPAPKAKKFKVIKPSLTEEAANDLVEKMKAKDEKKSEKPEGKTEKPGGKTEKPEGKTEKPGGKTGKQGGKKGSGGK